MPHTFPRPISILAGLGFPRQIESVGKALAFLEEYPKLMRDEAYEATREACRDALAGTATAEAAHDIFCAFTRRRGILL